MTTKEKLDLLWKYLLLIVLVYGFSQLGRTPSSMMFDHKMMDSPEHGMKWISGDFDTDDMNIEVEVEHVGDDSTMTVTINGKTVDIDDMELSKFSKGDDAHVFIKKMDRDHMPERERVKVIKRELIKEK